MVSPESEDDKYDNTDDSETDVGISLHGLNLGPRKKLIVLDLNGLLAHTLFTFERSSFLQIVDLMAFSEQS